MGCEFSPTVKKYLVQVEVDGQQHYLDSQGRLVERARAAKYAARVSAKAAAERAGYGAKVVPITIKEW